MKKGVKRGEGRRRRRKVKGETSWRRLLKLNRPFLTAVFSTSDRYFTVLIFDDMNLVRSLCLLTQVTTTVAAALVNPSLPPSLFDPFSTLQPHKTTPRKKNTFHGIHLMRFMRYNSLQWNIFCQSGVRTRNINFRQKVECGGEGRGVGVWGGGRGVEGEGEEAEGREGETRVLLLLLFIGLHFFCHGKEFSSDDRLSVLISQSCYYLRVLTPRLCLSLPPTPPPHYVPFSSSFSF